MGSSLRSRILLTAIMISSVSSDPAQAATHKVPSQFPTIQAAITASIPGDTVLVSPGTYAEAIDIPAGKDALSLIGKGTVIIDASPAGVAAGAGISIASTQVNIENLTIRHARTAGDVGDGIRSTSIGTTIKDVTVLNCQAAGIQLSAADGSVRNSTTSACTNGIRATADRVILKKVTVSGTTGVGILITGNDADIRNCSVTQGDDDGISVTGLNAFVKKCSIENADGSGIVVDGGGATVFKCDVTNVGDAGIESTGDANTIESNDVSAAGGTGVLASGNDVVIVKNTLSGLGQNGVNASGDTVSVMDNDVKDSRSTGIVLDGEDSDAIGNKVQNASGGGIEAIGDSMIVDQNDIRSVRGGFGVQLTDSSIGGVISFNTIRETTGAGIAFDNSTFAQVFSNEVRGCGFAGEPSVDVSGDNIQMSNNLVRDGFNDGIRITGDNCTINNNDVLNNLVDGIDVSGTSNSLNGNTVKGNLGEGIENSGTTTDMLNNVGSGNRIDFATDGSEGVFFSNVFGTGGQATLPEID